MVPHQNFVCWYFYFFFSIKTQVYVSTQCFSKKQRNLLEWRFSTSMEPQARNVTPPVCSCGSWWYGLTSVPLKFMLKPYPLMWLYLEKWSESCSVVSNCLWPHRLYSPWNYPGQNTAVGSLSLLQGIFPTQGSNPGLPHYRCILYELSHRDALKEIIRLNRS